VGVNNKKRRAAKRRKEARQRSAARGSGRPAAGNPFAAPEWDATSAYALVELQLTNTVRRLSGRKLDDAELRRQAESLERRIRPAPRYLLDELLADRLARHLATVIDGGWGAADLSQLVRRCAGERHLPTLASLLSPDDLLRLDTTDRLASGLRLAALLSITPLLNANQVAAASVGDRATEHPKLAQVRALLAKAESTDYDDEAEALSAKAQELITKYALARLVDQGAASREGRADFQVRRLWLDAPYVGAKAALVHHVASANRCRAAIAERFGFSLVLGSAADLDAVDLLVTSLLVQADAALLRHGRRYDVSGVPRTRSFRRSFLMAYAVRIGERLQAAEAEAVRAERDDRLLPVLRDHRVRVDEAFDAMVPHTEARAPSISNGEGWYAGLAAADLALLDVNGKLPGERAG
jgi:hypothetical protein